jgi:hypothetical protein
LVLAVILVLSFQGDGDQTEKTGGCGPY